MASQKVTIVAIGGTLTDYLWDQIQRWSNQRTTDDSNEWDPAQWPLPVRQEIDSLAQRLLNEALTPPVLYWSQHVDLWSMGDVYQRAIGLGSPESTHLLTNRFELFCRRIDSGEDLSRGKIWSDEDRWLGCRLEEAATAWSAFKPKRVIILIRDVMGGFWTDREVEIALNELPDWWLQLPPGP